MAMLQDGKYVDNQPTKATPTRAQYLNNECTHEDYYRAVAKTAGLSFKGSSILPRVKKALEKGDEDLNTIPLSTWDAFSIAGRPFTQAAFKAHGDFWSIAGGVCVAKQAAKDAAQAEITID